ncbi:DUF1289 domain-containing protein [Nitratireductor indicus]|uniref:DUF1289 domain-containing protein n=1 Tax=Nitratireductor indicus TaxID=721133 RepID=UPI0028756AAB|nr:DUF1289 domain-containing protein [Nitratireductor indicus]MDS1135435.1 DUF1289 domain-containing protein [Nitratireductor indicus]
MAEIRSPCILVCSLDPVAGFCVGCGRTGAEIAGWVAMTPSERDAVMEKLSARLQRLGNAGHGDHPRRPATRRE